MKDKAALARAIWQFLTEGRFFEKHPQWHPREVAQYLGVAAEVTTSSPSRPLREDSKRPGGAFRLFTDGACRGNPGPAGAGVVIQDEQGRVVDEYAEFLGDTTNNMAEYQALQIGLKRLLPLQPRNVVIVLDSELLVKQITGVYRTRHPQLKEKLRQVRELLARIPEWRVKHVPREQNHRADRLANQAINRYQNGEGWTGTQSIA